MENPKNFKRFTIHDKRISGGTGFVVEAIATDPDNTNRSAYVAICECFTRGMAEMIVASLVTAQTTGGEDFMLAGGAR